MVHVVQLGHGVQEPGLQLAHVAGEREQQRVAHGARPLVGTLVGAAQAAGSPGRRPQRGAGVLEEEVHLAVVRQGGQHPQPGLGQPRHDEDAEALPQAGEGRVRAQRRAHVVQQFGGGGDPDVLAHGPEHLGLPAQVVRDVGTTCGPVEEQARAGGAVAGEQAGEPGRGGRPAHARHVLARDGAQVVAQHREPRPRVGAGAAVGGGELVEHLQDVPRQGVRRPPLDRVGRVGTDPGDDVGHHAVEEPGRGGEVDARADAVLPVRAGPEVVGQPLRDPAFGAARADREHVGGEGVGAGGGRPQDVGEPGDEGRRALGTVDVEHGPLSTRPLGHDVRVVC